jgi:hypothetical protein
MPRRQSSGAGSNQTALLGRRRGEKLGGMAVAAASLTPWRRMRNWRRTPVYASICKAAAAQTQGVAACPEQVLLCPATCNDRTSIFPTELPLLLCTAFLFYCTALLHPRRPGAGCHRLAPADGVSRLHNRSDVILATFADSPTAFQARIGEVIRRCRGVYSGTHMTSPGR